MKCCSLQRCNFCMKHVLYVRNQKMAGETGFDDAFSPQRFNVWSQGEAHMHTRTLTDRHTHTFMCVPVHGVCQPTDNGPPGTEFWYIHGGHPSRRKWECKQPHQLRGQNTDSHLQDKPDS
jgi:hypothetical protein